jgi:hypothetical protein
VCEWLRMRPPSPDCSKPRTWILFPSTRRTITGRSGKVTAAATGATGILKFIDFPGFDPRR